MKKIFILSAALAMTAGFVSSCSDKDDALNYSAAEVSKIVSVEGNAAHPTSATVSFSSSDATISSFKVLVTPGGNEQNAYYIDATGSGAAYTATITSLTPGTTYRIQPVGYTAEGKIANIGDPTTWKCPKLAAPAKPVIEVKELVSPLQMDGADGHLIATKGLGKGMEFQIQAKEVEFDKTTEAWVPKKDAAGHYIWKFDSDNKAVYSYKIKNPKTGAEDTIEEGWTALNHNTDTVQTKQQGLPEYYVDAIPASYFRVRVAETATTEAGDKTEFNNAYTAKFTANDIVKGNTSTLDVTIYKDADAAEAKEGTNYVATFKEGKCVAFTVDGKSAVQTAGTNTLDAKEAAITYKVANSTFVIDPKNQTLTVTPAGKDASAYKAVVNHVYVNGKNNGIIEQKNVDVDILEQLTVNK